MLLSLNQHLVKVQQYTFFCHTMRELFFCAAQYAPHLWETELHGSTCYRRRAFFILCRHLFFCVAELSIGTMSGSVCVCVSFREPTFDESVGLLLTVDGAQHSTPQT